MDAPATQPSDEEITAAVWEMLRENMDISRNEIKTQLETNFNWELAEKKAVLKAATASFIEELENDAATAAEQEEEVEVIPKKKGGFSAPVQLSDALSLFLGEVVLPRTEVTKRVWAYIKEHDLQNPADRREILCDEKMEAVMNRKKIKMFKMTKVLSEHMKAVDSLQDIKAEPKVKAAAKAKTETTKQDTPKKGSGGFGAPVQLSDKLAALLGESIMPRTEVTKKIWIYIKENDLQNPANRREIMCDESLTDLFGTKKIDMFKMTSKISANLFPVDSEGSVGVKREAPEYDDEDEETTAAPKKKKAKKASDGTKKTGGFGGAVILSEPLAKVLNAQNGAVLEQWPRTEVVKVMWQYIREHNLQNPADKREIVLDSTMEKIFETKKFSMFQMAKFLKDHMTSVTAET